MTAGPVDIARACWGEGIPDWVLLLARQCEEQSQNAVAKRLSRSASLVSTVLRNKYAGDMVAVEEIVRGVYERKTLDCPALGTIPANVCRDWQLKSRQFVNVNAERVRMYRACHRCPRRQKGGSDAEA